jgi:hypothetical protein
MYHFPLPSLLLALISTFAQAAVTVDVNLDRLRAQPEAPEIQKRIEAMLPPEAAARLKALSDLFGFDPRIDLKRVVVNVPEGGAPTIRLVGLPAQRIAGALSLQGRAVALANGLTGYPLPYRDQAAFVALSSNEALIGHARRLENEKAAPEPLPALDAKEAVVVHFTPGTHPRAPIMELVNAIDLRADGAGHIAIAVTAKDEAGAIELDRRLGVFREMIAVGDKGRLPEVHDLQALLAATTQTRTGSRLDLVVNVPPELRQRAIDKLLTHLQERIGHLGNPGERPGRPHRPEQQGSKPE